MKKVCHMTSVHPAGDVRIFEKMCTSISQAGYETYLVAPGNSFENNGVGIIGIGERPSSRLKRFIESGKRVYSKALAIDADIYHFHDAELLRYGLKLKKKGKCVIFDSHEDTAAEILDKQWIPFFLRNILRVIFEKYQMKICKQLDAVISVTPHICERFKQYGCDVYMITNYPLIDSGFKYTEPALQNKKMIFVGAICDDWQQREIIELVYRQGARYVLCGVGTNEYLDILRSAESWDIVEYMGKVPHNELDTLFQDCVAGIAILRPNQNTKGLLGTLGNTKIFEYMAAGLPVICTNFRIWKDITTKHNCGICVEYNDKEEIAQAINLLLENPKLASEMGRNGREAVLSHYNWVHEEKKLLKMYEELLSNNKQSK